MRNRLRLMLITLGLAAVSLPILAHHPFSSEFDANKPVTLTGTVTAVDWNAPHVNISADVKNASGQATNWKFEGANPDTLTPNGWNSITVKKGDTVTFHAYRAKDGSNFASARSVTLANGRTMVISDAQEDGGPAADTQTTSLPSTASNVPLIGLAGLLALLGAFTARRFARVS